MDRIRPCEGCDCSSTLHRNAIWRGAGNGYPDSLENCYPARGLWVRLPPSPPMTITICGSMQFHHEMTQIQLSLEDQGHTVLVPKDLTILEQNESYMGTDEERISSKIEHDFIREHFKKIEKSDAILILNYEKKNIVGYVGGNTFLEMGYAFGLGKKIYLLYPVPEMDYKVEMHSMKPVVLHGDLSTLQ